MRSVYEKQYRSAHCGSQYEHSLYFVRIDSKKRRKSTATHDLIERDVDKVKVSKAVTSDGRDELDVLDLRERVMELVKMIERANLA